jgi:hypothetical protein
MCDLVILSIYAQQSGTSLATILVRTWWEGGRLNGENPGDSWGELAGFFDFLRSHSLSHHGNLRVENSHPTCLGRIKEALVLWSTFVDV